MTDIGTHFFGDGCDGGHMDEAHCEDFCTERCVGACGERAPAADTTTGDTNG